VKDDLSDGIEDFCEDIFIKLEEVIEE
ncbi:uncharacterized protein METZ01_LOCUS482348, partial [marine metagenome]